MGTGRKRRQYNGLIQQRNGKFHENLLFCRDGLPRSAVALLGRLACIAFVSGSTISFLRRFRDGGVRGSGGSFLGPVQRIGFTAFTAMLMLITVPQRVSRWSHGIF